MDGLIKRIGVLAKDENPYNVSKEIEEIKSIFYIKLKLEKEKKQIIEKNEEEIIEKQNKDEHHIEEKLKSIFKTYQKSKSDFRKNKE